MTPQELKSLVYEAQQLARILDDNTERFAEMLVGRLRKVSAYECKRLKRELSAFNAHTGEWRD